MDTPHRDAIAREHATRERERAAIDRAALAPLLPNPFTVQQLRDAGHGNADSIMRRWKRAGYLIRIGHARYTQWLFPPDAARPEGGTP